MAIEQDNNVFCGCTVIHEDIVRNVKTGLTEQTQLIKMAELFKAMSDPTRLKIVNALMLSEMCVCDIACLLKMTGPAVSHHLKTLRQCQLIKYRKDGKIVYYSLDDEHIAPLFKQGYEHVSEK